VGRDASQDQVREAVARDNVLYGVGLAEAAPLRTASLDLIPVAQAAHWFDLSRFYEEVMRTLKPDGVIALWAYSLCRISPEIDERLDEVYSEFLWPFWPPDRKQVDDQYATIPFPFTAMKAPLFFMTEHWALEDFIMYISTWSAVGEYRKVTGNDPVPRIAKTLSEVWLPPEAPREIRWPICLRVGMLP